jgi:thioredoxin 1
MSTAKAVTDETFGTDVLGGPGPVIVEYWAQWCGPCRQVGPVLDAIAAERAGQVTVVKVNVDENPQITQRYGILQVPTIELFRDGEAVKQVIGSRSKSALMREFAEFI